MPQAAFPKRLKEYPVSSRPLLDRIDIGDFKGNVSNPSYALLSDHRLPPSSKTIAVVAFNQYQVIAQRRMQ
jgi:hypothetical protein